MTTASALATGLLLGLAPVPGTPSGTAHATPDAPDVLVNQIGYLRGADKVATVVTPSDRPLRWRLRKADGGRTVATGTTRPRGEDRASGDRVQHADFSRFSKRGRYVLDVAGAGRSDPFLISDDGLYPKLGAEAMQYFYFHRMGTPVRGRYLQDRAHAHRALHPGDASVPCYRRWCGKERLHVRGSWSDAGDFGIYPVNHAVSAWTLLNLHERYPDIYPDGSLRIPERDNGRPDLVDEVAYGSRFMSGMLPRRGLASHKVHNHEWSGFPPKSVAEENRAARSAMPPSTNATYAVARTNAQLARVLAPYAPERAERLWSSAQDAWSRARKRPDVDYPNGKDAEGGGDYPDRTNSDDRYAAAAELYLTAFHRSEARPEARYLKALKRSRHYGQIKDISWNQVEATGTLSLLSVDNDLPEKDLRRMRARVRKHALRTVATLRREGYPATLSGEHRYPWGSNASVANSMLMLGVAYDTTHRKLFLRAMNRAMDYLMGQNAMRLSYITGYGERSETDVHDRMAWKKFPRTPYPRGWISGGPNNTQIDDTATPKDRPAAKSYAPGKTAPAAWSSKENTINWNAPLVWVATHLDRSAPDLDGPRPAVKRPAAKRPAAKGAAVKRPSGSGRPPRR